MSVISYISDLLKEASKLGLNIQDLKNAEDLFKHHEFGLCLDTILTQMYEYDIKITVEFYELIEKSLNSMKLPLEKYSFMQDLILK